MACQVNSIKHLKEELKTYPSQTISKNLRERNISELIL